MFGSRCTDARPCPPPPDDDEHAFGSGEPCSLGIEKELFLVDPETGEQIDVSDGVICATSALPCRAADVLDHMWSWWKLRPHPRAGAPSSSAPSARRPRSTTSRRSSRPRTASGAGPRMRSGDLTHSSGPGDAWAGGSTCPHAADERHPEPQPAEQHPDAGGRDDTVVAPKSRSVTRMIAPVIATAVSPRAAPSSTATCGSSSTRTSCRPGTSSRPRWTRSTAPSRSARS